MATQTKAGSILGTVCYMSPEQVRSKNVDERSDIFSLGAILYEMVTGKRAFAGETEADTMMAVLKEDPPQTALAEQGVPPAFQQIIFHCLEKEPQERFQSVRDLAFALSTVSTANSKQRVAPRPRPALPRKKLLWIVAGFFLLAVGAFSASATQERRLP